MWMHWAPYAQSMEASTARNCIGTRTWELVLGLTSFMWHHMKTLLLWLHVAQGREKLHLSCSIVKWRATKASPGRVKDHSLIRVNIPPAYHRQINRNARYQQQPLPREHMTQFNREWTQPAVAAAAVASVKSHHLKAPKISSPMILHWFDARTAVND